jgi:hypothetical protein
VPRCLQEVPISQMESVLNGFPDAPCAYVQYWSVFGSGCTASGDSRNFDGTCRYRQPRIAGSVVVLMGLDELLAAAGAVMLRGLAGRSGRRARPGEP